MLFILQVIQGTMRHAVVDDNDEVIAFSENYIMTIKIIISIIL